MAQAVENDDLLVVKNLKKHYAVNNRFLNRQKASIKAVDGVSFTVKRGETFSIVGESGCGKSTLGMCLNRLVEPTSGEIIFDGQDVINSKHHELRKIRSNMQVIFQDPYSSLNPKHTIRQIVSEPLVIHGIRAKSELEDRVASLLKVVGLGPHHMDRYPHEFSGGQRQRIGIARALALNPKLIICDEPVSALDVSIQSQILNLLKELQQQMGLTYIFISHDLSVVEYIGDHVAVMYLGKIVEQGKSEEVFSNPQHPYTKALLSSAPVADPKRRKEKKRVILQGDLPSPKNPPKGCHFHSRCPSCMDICLQSYPETKEVGKDHYVACHL